MPRYSVNVTYSQSKDIKVWAPDEEAAIEKACEIVEGWNGVISADATDADELDE